MRYWKSPAAEAEFAKYHLQYPDNEFQDEWDRHIRRLSNDPNKKDKITQMRRVKIGEGLEFITYTHILSGHDQLGSFWEKGQAEIGTYPILHAQNVRELNEEDGQYVTITKSYTEELSYWIAFNKENIDNLHKLCYDTPSISARSTAYTVMPDGGTEISVRSFKDWSEGEFDELYEYGMIVEEDDLPEVVKKKKS